MREDRHFLEPFHVPNRVFIFLGWLIVLATTGFALWVYPLLPNQIPTHFGVSGTPDAYAAKSVWSFFGLIIIMAVLTVGLSILYRYPRYAHIPGTLLIALLKPEAQAQLSWFIQHMLALILVLLDALFAYLTIGIAATSLGQQDGLDPRILFGLTGLLVLIAIAYEIAGAVFTRRLIMQHQLK